MQVKKRELVLTVAYMIGVPDQRLSDYSNFDGYEKILGQLKNHQAASVIRYLSKLRTAMMRNFVKTDALIRYDMKNLRTIEWFDNADLDGLRAAGIEAEQANYTASKYMMDFSRLIADNIGKCESMFRDWQRFDLIRRLFVIPKYQKEEAIKKEYEKYHKNYKLYPYQMYVYDLPGDCGNLLLDDERFLQTLILNAGEKYQPNNYSVDASVQVKNEIYDFIGQSGKTVFVVDCENSDVYKLMGVVRSLDPTVLEKVSRIVLFDDQHTTIGWDHFDVHTSLPVEHILVERLIDRKSLVDISLAVNVCKLHYEENVDSFVIVSSDSDYWGLISSLPSAKFLVMYEYGQVSRSIKETLSEHGYYYCSIDSFCTGDIEDFVKAVVFSSLEEQFEQLDQLDTQKMITEAFAEIRYEVSDHDKMRFHDKYMRNLKFTLDKDGRIRFENK